MTAQGIGFTPATAGGVQLFGYDSYRLPGAAKARIGFVPQQDELVNQLTAADQIGVIASFYPKWDDELVGRLSREWEVDLNQRVKNMSVGQRQKLSILLGLGHKPDVLILDEPVASLDPVARRQFLEQIIEVASDGNRSVVFSSHIVSDLERAANKAVRFDGSAATATVANWQPSTAEALAQRFDAAVEVERLGLEEIFVELHR